ncbi:hypothetical protein ACQVRV_00295 (plasmid) [Ralstonia pseudosolanacearum]
MKKMLFFAVIMTAIYGVSYAETGSPQRGGMCFTNNVRIKDAEITWACEHIGRATVKQIYEKGFRVVGMYSTDPSDKTAQFQYLVIEEQRR